MSFIDSAMNGVEGAVGDMIAASPAGVLTGAFNSVFGGGDTVAKNADGGGKSIALGGMFGDMDLAGPQLSSSAGSVASSFAGDLAAGGGKGAGLSIAGGGDGMKWSSGGGSHAGGGGGDLAAALGSHFAI
jgi:hypothetical protein